MKRLFCLVRVMSLFVCASGQKAHPEGLPAQGIQFEQGLSWEQIKVKAKKENKYIFLDAYTTWCVPCKKMDIEVYPNDTIGNYMNTRFVSVKVQMDSTGRDNEQVKSWYTAARFINGEFKVEGFPCFLFFNPAGTLIYKETGYKNVPDFLQLVGKALDSQNIVYYSKLEDYIKGERNYAEMYELIKFVKKTMGNDSLAKQMAEDYIAHADKKQWLTQEKIFFVMDVARNRKLADSLALEYRDNVLNRLGEEEFCTWDNLRFLELFNHLITSRDKVFQLSYSKPQKIDSARNSPGAAKRYVQSVIIREEITVRLFKDDKPVYKDPDWDKLRAMIQEKYPVFDVNTMLLNYQIYYYSKINDCRQWARYKSEKIKLDLLKPVSPNLFFELNDLGAWEAFLSCNDEKVLAKALEWIELAIKLNNNNYGFLDTRANLLYKLGRVKEAIAQEEKAVEMIMAYAAQEGSDVAYLIEHAGKYKEVIATMKKREPTYLKQRAAWDAKSLQRIRSVKPEKPLIDTIHFSKWLSVRPTLTDAKAAISNDGRYALYKIQESWSLPATVIVQTINADPKATGWKTELHGVENAVFTEDSRQAFFIQSDDSLYVLTLGSSSKEFIARVSAFRLFKQAEKEWLAYRSNTADKELILQNLETGKQQSFPAVIEYLISRDGNILVLKTGSGKNGGIPQSLSWINLSKGSRTIIWEGDNASNFVLDDKGFQLAFKSESKLNDQTEISFWYYKEGTTKAVQVINSQSTELDTGLQLSNILKFDKNRNKLFINLKEKDAVKPEPDAVKVDVWSYTDARLQSQQLNERWAKSYVAVLDISDKGIIPLQLDNDVVLFGMDELADSLVLINSREGEYGERNWNRTAIPSFYLVNTSTGERKEISIGNPHMSLRKKYIIGISPGMTDIYSYEIAKGITHNLTHSLPIPVGGVEFDEPYILTSRGLRIAATTENKESIIVYDEFDIWQLDPSGMKAPVNLTNGYGRKNKIEFRLAGMYSGKDIPDKGELIVLAFNKINKNSGFYKVSIGKKGDPELLSMGPYYYEPGYMGACQIKARDADIYIVMRETAAESPNYFWTKDFKTFIRLSAVYPEKKYNWLRSELITFRTLDGRSEQAVVYKPENFDPQKKYPVVLHYYDRMTQQLNRYPKPGGYAHLDIPWFVSHGYIVVTPDIHYRIGETGKSAYNTIVGLAKYLARFSWIDAKHIGLQGHSFGGYQTNYIVTQTNLFAAAVSSSGMSDIVSNYLGFLSNHTNHDWYENRICRIGSTLWEKPDLYIRNSPVFYADKVSTPLLTVANKRDGNVRFEQGLEWFIALRRLGKKIWMLQYDEADHALGPEEYKDYVIRMTQFFDHYLKGMPAPKWMTRGIPAKMKGIDDGLELDYEIKTPGPGLLIEKKVAH